MNENKNKLYLVPDYYKEFKCKGGLCRNSCCKGWDISISLDEYYHLSSLQCKKKTRERLDKSLKILNNPTKEKYAILASNYFGDCCLHDTDGYCLLQKECGEKDLPSICKLYPRRICNSEHNHVCISNSCERIIEMFISNNKKIDFNYQNLEISNRMQMFDNNSDYDYRIQEFCIGIMSNRLFTLQQRLSVLEEVIIDLNKDYFSLDLIITKYNNNEYNHNLEMEVNIDFYLQLEICRIIGKKSKSILSYISIIEDYYNISLDNISADLPLDIKLYKKAIQNFKTKFSNYEILFEKILVNHMFYMNFPLNRDLKENTLYRNYIALLESYSFTRFIVATLMENLIKLEYKEEDNVALVDIIGETFRLIEHSSFDLNVNIILSRVMEIRKGEV